MQIFEKTLHELHVANESLAVAFARLRSLSRLWSHSLLIKHLLPLQIVDVRGFKYLPLWRSPIRSLSLARLHDYILVPKLLVPDYSGLHYLQALLVHLGVLSLLNLFVFRKCSLYSCITALDFHICISHVFGLGRRKDEAVIHCEDLSSPKVCPLGLLVCRIIGVVGNSVYTFRRIKFRLRILHGLQGVHELLLAVYHRVLLLVLNLYLGLLLVIEE